MNSQIQKQLVDLNRAFYDQHAEHFAASRSSFPGGVLRAMEWLSGSSSLLDVGCGDGRVGRALLRQQVPNEVERYLGLDFSKGLLEQPTERVNPFPAGFQLQYCDLSSEAWAGNLDEGSLADGRLADVATPISSPFEAAVCLAVLFHIPGAAMRQRVVDGIFSRLESGGRAVFSVWQFLHVPRIQRKIVDWSEVGLSADVLEPDDLLLDWWRGGHGLRYVHHFRAEELVGILETAGFAIEGSYRSDGATGDMSLFVQVSVP